MRYVSGVGSRSNLSLLLARLPKARRVLVVTYNLGTLVTELTKCGPEAEVTVFTNVPSRYESYYTSKHAQDAKKKIAKYTSLLDAKRFRCQFHAYFALENHSKILVVDDEAYVGSANFGDDNKNFETGIILNDARLIRSIAEDVTSQLLESERTIPYVAGPSAELMVEIQQLDDEFESAMENLDEQMIEVSSHEPYGEYLAVSFTGNYAWIGRFMRDFADAVEDLDGRWSEHLDRWFSGERSVHRAAFEQMAAAGLATRDLPKELAFLFDHDYLKEHEGHYSDVSWKHDELDNAIEEADSLIREDFERETEALKQAIYEQWKERLTESWRASVSACFKGLRAVATPIGLDNT